MTSTTPGTRTTKSAPGYTTADAAADGGMLDPGYRPPAAEAPEPTRRTLWGAALYETFVRPGARVGLVWVVVLVLLGIFAPFLANSHPVVMKTSNGVVSSPLVAHLSAADYVLLIAFFAGLGTLFFPGMSGPRRVAVVLWAVTLVLPFATWPLVSASLAERFPTPLTAVLLICCFALIIAFLAAAAWFSTATERFSPGVRKTVWIVAGAVAAVGVPLALVALIAWAGHAPLRVLWYGLVAGAVLVLAVLIPLAGHFSRRELVGFGLPLLLIAALMIFVPILPPPNPVYE